MRVICTTRKFCAQVFRAITWHIGARLFDDDPGAGAAPEGLRVVHLLGYLVALLSSIYFIYFV